LSANEKRHVQFGTPTRDLARYAKGRTCDHAGCATILSVYNSASLCGVHETSVTRPPLHGRSGRGNGGARAL
jgi:hypothetical protein